MKKSSLSATLMTGFALLLTLSAASSDCWAVLVYFDGSTSTDFQVGSNWTPENAPGTNLVDTYSIDDGLSSTFSGGSTRVRGLRVGSAAKEHPFGEIHFGQLTMTGGSLEVIGSSALGLFVVGRENQRFYPVGGDYNKNTVVDTADYTVWRDTLGSMSDLRADGDDSGTIDAPDYDFWKARFGNVVRGGEFMMTGSSTLTANGVIIGERTKGLLSVGPNAVAEFRTWDTIVEPNQFGGTQDIRIGSYGPAYDWILGDEEGLDADGLVDVEGTLLAKDLYLSEHGGKGELRLSGGTVNLNGALIMSFCDATGSTGGCFTDPDLLALMSSKVSIIGSSGTFNVGLDPDPAVLDPLLMPPERDIRSNYPSTATFSFTADAGGVTPIVVVDNGAELSGTAHIAGTNLELDLDAYTSTAPLTLIDAAPGHLPAGTTFGTVTFLGSRTATPEYDYFNGDVRLINFQGGAGGGSLAGAAVPEPAGLIMMLTLGLLLFTLSARANRQRVRLWGYQCLKIRA